jgi:hypothetical protein
MTKIPVCPLTVRGPWGDYPWPCVLADGHLGDCLTNPESADYTLPFAVMEPAVMLAALIVEYGQARALLTERADQLRRNTEAAAATNALLHLVANTGSGRSGKHDPTCPLRHPACLAAALLYRRPADVLAALEATVRS